MDVARAQFGLYLLLPLAAALTACGNPLNRMSGELVEKTVDSCAPTAIADQYVVHWKTGAFTTVNAESRAELIEKVIEPNIDKIEFAENDQVISIKPPATIGTQGFGEVPPPNWGQDRVGATDLWAQGIDGNGVIVAVVDSGAQLSHPSLENQIAVNANEVVNGIDDDRNGYVDDVKGWDFVSNSPNVTDGAGHGTHVAGVIAGDHASGSVKGIAPRARILPLGFMDSAGSGLISNAVRAMYYANSRGAKIINASWGGSACSRSLRVALADLSSKGVLFISASGNGDDWGRAEDISKLPIYPAAFAIGNQISVGASTYADAMAGFSNYSPTLVHLLAPGVDILSSYPTSTWKLLQGTSMATPFVAGAAALLWSHQPTATAKQIHDALLDSVDPGGFPVMSGGRLNVRRAVLALDAALDAAKTPVSSVSR